MITLKDLFDNNALNNGFFTPIHPSEDFPHTPMFYRFFRSNLPAGGIDIDIYNEKGELLSGRSLDLLSLDQRSSNYQLVESLEALPPKLQELAKSMPVYANAQRQPKCTTLPKSHRKDTRSPGMIAHDMFGKRGQYGMGNL